TEGHLVCAYLDGVEPDASDSCDNALNSAIVKNGSYKLPHLPQGKYKVQVFDRTGKPIGHKKSDATVTAAKYKKLPGDDDADDEGSGKGDGKGKDTGHNKK